MFSFKTHTPHTDNELGWCHIAAGSEASARSADWVEKHVFLSDRYADRL